jgi:predicted glycosyltransferase
MDAVVVTGPTMSPTHRDELLQHVPPSVEIYNCVDGADTWIRDASAVVTLGGYNSLCEVLAAGRKAVVIPRSGPSAEQITRARLFAERGLLRTLDAAELSASRLSANLLGLLADDSVPNHNNVPPLDGAANAARVLLGADPNGSGDANGTTSRKQLAGVFSGAISNGSRGSGGRSQ